MQNRHTSYVQMVISSTEGLSKELVGIVSARNMDELLISIGKNKDYWLSIFKTISGGNFDHLYEFHNYAHTSTYSYISLPAALSFIDNFKKGSIAYGTEEKQKKKFKQLLNALSFLDSDLFVTLILRRFNWSLVDELLGLNE